MYKKHIEKDPGMGKGVKCKHVTFVDGHLRTLQVLFFFSVENDGHHHLTKPISLASFCHRSDLSRRETFLDPSTEDRIDLVYTLNGKSLTETISIFYFSVYE